MNRMTRYVITDGPHRRSTTSTHEAAEASAAGATVTAVVE